MLVGFFENKKVRSFNIKSSGFREDYLFHLGQMHTSRKWNGGDQGLGGGVKGSCLMDKVSVLQDDKSSGDLSHNSVNMVNII